MHVSTWDSDRELQSVLGKLETLYPPAEHGTQTHILHLASEGDIFPHVDNVEASGTWIMGVSLGATRRLCLEPVEQDDQAAGKGYETVLPSGSVYIQRCASRGNVSPCSLGAHLVSGSTRQRRNSVSLYTLYPAWPGINPGATLEPDGQSELKLYRLQDDTVQCL